MGLALAATALTVVAGCSSTGGTTGNTDAAGKADSGLGSPSKSPSGNPSETSTATGTTTTKKATPAHTTSTTTAAGTTTVAGPEIVYFKVAQKPHCAQGTNLYQSPAVPLIIKWKISHATSGALSVDDPTHTPGTYGPVSLTGSQDFSFSCAGPVGTVETHTYAIYSVGGGAQHSKSLTVSTKVLDKGTTVN